MTVAVYMKEDERMEFDEREPRNHARVKKQRLCSSPDLDTSLNCLQSVGSTPLAPVPSTIHASSVDIT